MSELCVLQNLKKVEYDPWPYIIIENALPEKVHNELLQTLPNDRLDKQQQVDQHGKLTWLLKELHEEQYPVSNIWKEFIEYHTSKQFVDKVFDAFEKKSKNLAIPRDQLIKADINNPAPCSYFTDFSFVKHPPVNNVSNKIPHTDNPKEIYAGLLYLKSPEDKSTGGDFCIHKPKGLGMNSVREYSNPGPIVKTCPYVSNNFVMFWNGEETQHSVSPRQDAEHPRWSINMISRFTGTRNWIST